MIIQIAAFTETGRKTAKKIAGLGDTMEFCFYDKAKSSLSDWTKAAFEKKTPLVYVGAVGIAVRTIAPFVESKLTDSPVIVVDEQGQYVIPILSGHVGGANELARVIALHLGASPVITTATDINSVFAVDVFAVKNGFSILKKDGIKQISSRLLKNEQVSMAVETGHEIVGELPAGIKLVEYPPAEDVDIVISDDEDALSRAVMPLRPKRIILGMGCKKGKPYQDIEAIIDESGIDLDQVYALATIDIKKDEPGFLELVERNRIKLITYTGDQLLEAKGDFSASDFVKATVGVDNVCERSAVLAAGENGSLLTKKKAKNGVTLAVSKRDWRVEFE